MWSSGSSHTLLVEKQNNTAVWKTQCSSCLKREKQWPIESHLFVFILEKWKPGSHRNSYTNVYSNISLSPKTENSLSALWWVSRYIVLCPHHGIPLSNTKWCTIDAPTDLGDLQVHFAKWENSVSTDYKGYDSIYQTLWKQQKYRNKTDEYLPGGGVGGLPTDNVGILWDGEILLYPEVVFIRVCVPIKTHRKKKSEFYLCRFKT